MSKPSQPPGRSIPLKNQITRSKKQNDVLIQNSFLAALANAIAPETKVTLITDAGFQSEWFRHIKSLGWDFIGRIRGIAFIMTKKTGWA